MQNIFDNPDFFEGYSEIRGNKDNYNDLLEQPAMERLLPDYRGMDVLDLGCGAGGNCRKFAENGAKSVLGVDISENMLSLAEKENAVPGTEYIKMSMNDIDKTGRSFDLIYSSLAFHYIEDFGDLIRKIYDCLKPGGILLFSQEHPFITATPDGLGGFNKDSEGKRISYTFSDYGRPGKRQVSWLVDGVINYHRRISDIINTLINAGFYIEHVEEPLPSPEAAEICPDMLIKESIRPVFLIVRARK